MSSTGFDANARQTQLAKDPITIGNVVYHRRIKTREVEREIRAVNAAQWATADQTNELAEAAQYEDLVGKHDELRQLDENLVASMLVVAETGTLAGAERKQLDSDLAKLDIRVVRQLIAYLQRAEPDPT
ncbi:MAG: hypothetical protein M0P31_18985 [Solirubrobacteraceae bacterium]|nr:hypothetical protein [Solirubrobacteraceae bacterium]